MFGTGALPSQMKSKVCIRSSLIPPKNGILPMMTDSAKATQTAASIRFPNFTRYLPYHPKQHHYTHAEEGVDYQFEAIDRAGQRGYMTGQGRGVQVGDRVVLQHNHQAVNYQVEAIDYYACPADMWVGLLARVVNR